MNFLDNIQSVYFSVTFLSRSPIHRGTGYCFRSISLFICFFLCFFVSKITRKRLHWFAWNFQGRCGVTMGRPGSIFGQFGETARCCDANFFVSNITSKLLKRFTWNFQGRCGVTMGWPDYIFGQFRETTRCRYAQHGDGVCCAFAPQLVWKWERVLMCACFRQAVYSEEVSVSSEWNDLDGSSAVLLRPGRTR